MLTSDRVMSHFDPSVETQLKVDASPFGLGAVRLQGSEGDERPVAYASRTLTDVERRYSQTEKEALAVVRACERFHIYFYGQEFKLYTDHKALEIIYSPRSKPPPRIERWSLRLQPYRFTIHHIPGQQNPADVLSRMPLASQPFRERSIADEYIHYVATRAVPKAAPEPLRPTAMPDKPWQDIHIDLCGPFPTGESLLVCEDACTRWPEVVILKTTTSAVIISHLKKIFAAQGILVTVISDNGPQFVSEEFEALLRDYGIAHRKVTPYWPQANAQVERFNRTIEKAIRGAHVEGKDWRKELFTFLLNYRATPHAMTGVSPALLHLGREIRTKVPQVEVPITGTLESALRKAQSSDSKLKQKMAEYTDTRKKAKPSTVKIGDNVLLQQIKNGKTNFRHDMIAIRTRLSKDEVQVLFYNEVVRLQ